MAEADAVCGADYGERSTDRTTTGTATVKAVAIRGQAHWILRFPSCGTAPISRTGFWNAVNAERALTTVGA
jgi:hypothetical protein